MSLKFNFLCLLIYSHGSKSYFQHLSLFACRDWNATSNIYKIRSLKVCYLYFDKFFLHPHTLFLHPHIIFLFHSCPSWNYINIHILIKPLPFPTGWSGHPIYSFLKLWTGWEVHQVLIFKKNTNRTTSSGSQPSRSKNLQIRRRQPPNPKSTTLIINITY